MKWEAVTQEANKYVEPLRRTPRCGRYLEEIAGLAVGSGVAFLDILALNIRTEIMFGLFTDPTSPQYTEGIPSDGCTSLGWVDASGQSFVAQNWDWQQAQGPNLIVCHVAVSQPQKEEEKPVNGVQGDDTSSVPRFAMVTEAGIIGKIGFNENGVGCCLNAIRARGVDPHRLPVHFALRTVLESRSRKEAIARLEASGVAGTAHILVGDETGSSGLECTPIGIKELGMDPDRRVYHTNHLILDHPGVTEPAWLQDSHTRLARIQELAEAGPPREKVDFGQLIEMFKDENDGACSINRKQDGTSGFETLFTIIMNLSRKEALVKFGRPTEEGVEILLTP